MTNIKITDKTCWRCGSVEKIQSHHCIPQYMKPISNIEVPMCDDCHKELHGQDMNCITAMAHKIKKTLMEGVSKTTMNGFLEMCVEADNVIFV